MNFILRACWIFVAALIFSASTAAAAPHRVEVLSDAPDKTVLRFDLLNYGFDPVAIDGAPYALINLPRSARRLVAGAPDVPSVTRSVLVDADAKLELAVVGSSFTDVSEVDLAPSKGNLTRDLDPASVPYAFGAGYQSDAFYPGALATLGAPYLLRTHRGVSVTFEPFQYNPVTRVLRVYESITVEVRRVGTSSVNVLPANAAALPTRAFDDLARGHFANFGSTAAYTALNEEGGMLIIAADEWIPNLQPLIDHKNAIGIPTTVVGISTVGNSSSSIKTYIQNQYASSNIAFVLLVGDVSQIATPYNSGGAADPTYAKVAGTDPYPDIMIGRLSASSPAHVDTQVARTIAFEIDQAPTQPWFKKAVGIGSEEGPGDDGQYDYQHIDAIRDQLLGAGFTEVDQFYGYDAGPGDVVAALNEGRGLVNYCGHGSPTQFGTTGFSNSDVPSLSNTGKLPFVMSVACNSGEFDTGTCLGEAMMRATKNGQPTGSVGFYASSISQSWNPPMEAQDEMNSLFIAGEYSTMGALFYAGSAQMIDQYGSDGAAMFNTWHLFGDPSLRLVGTVEPAGAMSVSPNEDFASSGAEGGPFSPAQQVYVVANNGDAPFDFTVSGMAPWLAVTPTSGTVAPSSSVNVTVTIGGTAPAAPPGQYHTALAFVNTTDGQGDTSRSVALTIGEPNSIHRFPLDSNPGWTVEGAWAFGKPTGAGASEDFGYPDPSAGFTGQNVYGNNLTGDYSNNLGPQTLTTTAIDCTGLSGTRLLFQRWLNLEGSEFDHGSVAISRDGATWTNVWANSADVTDNQWQLVDLDIAELADNQATVFMRWTLGTTDEGLVASGWNIDDIELVAYPGGCSDDADGDGDPAPECGGGDCNESDSSTFFGAAELCDGIDNDCDGTVDEDCEGSPVGPGGGDGEDAEAANDLRGILCSVEAPRSTGSLAFFVLLGLAGLRLRRSRATR